VSILVGAHNCRAELGLDWDTCLRYALAAGVPILRPTKRKRLIRADALVAALEARAREEQITPEDHAETVRRALGRGAK
jgi:hypothetical protein